jgi:hypothetical protein
MFAPCTRVQLKLIISTRKLSNDNRIAWESLPQHLRYDLHKDTCWKTQPGNICLRMLNLYLEHLFSDFQMQRVRRRYFPDAIPDLLHVSMQVLTTVLVLNKQRNHQDYRMQRFHASMVSSYDQLE